MNDEPRTQSPHSSPLSNAEPYPGTALKRTGVVFTPVNVCAALSLMAAEEHLFPLNLQLVMFLFVITLLLALLAAMRQAATKEPRQWPATATFVFAMILVAGFDLLLLMNARTP